MKTQLPSRRNVFAGVTKTFRGGIAENCKRYKFSGDGYKSMPPEQRGEFQIQSARQVAGPMRALVDDFVRLVHIIGATQVLKSIVGDAWVIYVLEHVLRPMLVLFEDEGKADLYCAARLMETVRKHPHISKMLQASQKDNRHNVTGTWIKTAMMQLLVAGLNDGNVSSLSWPLIWISEAWQHGKDGLQWKAYKRADRYPDDHKILNESQASVVDTDLHVSAREAHQVPLEWPCPACKGMQTWEYHHWNYKRPPNFEPRPVEGIEVPKPGTYAGMIIPDDAGGTRSVMQRALGAYWECIWCGFHIEDKRAIRQQLMDSYIQDYTVSQGGIITTPPKLTFTLPFEAARDNRFAATVESFLIAKHEERQGNKVKLAQWFMADRALFFSEEILRPQVIQVSEKVDLTTKIPNWHHDGMTVDVQKDKVKDEAGTFHVSIDSADISGNSFELFRGFIESWDELIALQKKFKIPNRFVNMDGRKWTPQIRRMAAANHEWITVNVMGRPTPITSCWNILLGDGPRRHYPWPDADGRKQFKLYSVPTKYIEYVTDKFGKRLAIPVYQYLWSNFSVKELLSSILEKGEGKSKFVALPYDQLSPKDQLFYVGNMSYDKQMSSEYRTEKNGTKFWATMQNRPNHEWDKACMRIVRLLMNNRIGYVATQEETPSS